MKVAIECQDLKRVYTTRSLLGKKQETAALNGINFTIEAGTVFGLLGPNGSGKTTTIRILSTLLTPTSGQAKVMGFDCVKDAAKVRKHIGLILGGERGLYGRLSANENLRYFAALNRIPREPAQKRIKEIIDLVGLTEACNRPVEQYSRGMRQRLHIARGLLTNPDVVFMDEPTIGLDPAGAQELRQFVPRLTGQGKTVLLTTHYMSEADELSSYIAIINKGRVIATGTSSEIKKRFSKIAVLEVAFRGNQPGVIEKISQLKGVEKVGSTQDGPIQKLSLQVQPGVDIRPEVKKLLGESNIDYISMRDPTLEEAYLSIIK